MRPLDRQLSAERLKCKMIVKEKRRRETKVTVPYRQCL